MHVYVRTTYDQIYSAKKKKSSPEVRSRDEDVEKCVCAKIQGLSLKTGVGIRTVVRKTCVFYVVA